MSSRSWGATGIPILQSFSFSGQDRRNILSAINPIKGFDPDRFIKNLEYAVGIYLSHKLLSEKSRPKAVRENLTSVFHAMNRANIGFNKLDGNSRQLLAEVGQYKSSIF